MSLEKKANNPWAVCKVVEEGDNGELHLLEENLKHLLSLIKKPKCDQMPIIFASFLGSSTRDVSLLTNLFTSYVACNGQGWSSKITAEGLKWFVPGSGVESHTTDDSNGKDVTNKKEPNGNRRDTDDMVTRSSKRVKKDVKNEPNPVTNETYTINNLVEETLKLEIDSINCTKEKKNAIADFIEAAQKVKRMGNCLKPTRKDDKVEESETGISRGRNGRKQRTRGVRKNDDPALPNDNEAVTTSDKSEGETTKKSIPVSKDSRTKEKGLSNKETISSDVDTQSEYVFVEASDISNEPKTKPAILTSEVDDDDTTIQNCEADNVCTSSEDNVPLFEEGSLIKIEENTLSMDNKLSQQKIVPDISHTVQANLEVSPTAKTIGEYPMSKESEDALQHAIINIPEDGSCPSENVEEIVSDNDDNHKASCLPEKENISTFTGLATPTSLETKSLEKNVSMKCVKDDEIEGECLDDPHTEDDNGLSASSENIEGKLVEIQTEQVDNVTQNTSDENLSELTNRNDNERETQTRSHKTPPVSEDESVAKSQGLDELVHQNDKDCTTNQDKGESNTDKNDRSDNNYGEDAGSSNPHQNTSNKNCVDEISISEPLENKEFYPNYAKSGIYFWPEIFKLDCGSGPKLLVVVHAHHKTTIKFEDSQLSTSLLAATICSRIADVKCKNMFVFELLKKLVASDKKYSPLQDELCSEVVKILREENSSEPESLSSSKEFVIFDNDDITNKLSLTSKQFRAFKNLAESLLDECDLTCKLLNDGKTELNTNSIKRFMQQAIDKINVCNGFKSISRSPHIPRKKPISPAPDRVKRSLTPSDDAPQKFVPSNNSTSTMTTPSALSDESTDDAEYPPPSKIAPIRKYADSEQSNSRIYSRKLQNDSDNNPTPKALTLTKVAENTEENLGHGVIEKFMCQQALNLKENLKEWINGNLNVGNVKEIQKLVYDNWYANCTDSILKIQRNKEVTILKPSENFMKKACQVSQDLLTEVGTGIHQFYVGAEAHLTKSQCILPGQLNEKLYEIRKNILQTKESKSEAAPFIEQGCTKLIIYYLECNGEMIRNEKNVAVDAIPQLVKFYTDYFTNILCQKDFICPSHLWSLHTAILSELQTLYRNIFSNPVIFTEEMGNLASLLSKEYEDLFSRYINKLNVAQTKIKGFIKIQKDEYDRQMDTLLTTNPNGMKTELFDEQHYQLLTVAQQSLKNDVLQEISELEPIENHAASLQKHIDKMYHDFAQENKINSESSQDQIGKPEIADVTAVAAAEPTDVIPKIEIGRGNSRNQNGSEIKTRGEPGIASKPNNNIKKLKIISQPMIIQMALQSIRFCFHVTTTKKKKIESFSHPAQVGLSGNGEWVCGDKITTLAEKHPGYFVRVWDLEACLTSSQWQDEQKLMMGGTPFTITAEFLLAIFFRFFKEAMESNMEGELSTALVSVPFWFSSTQRLVISEAVNLAGFKKVTLVNENSAAAFHAFANKTIDPKFEAIVITENSQKVDISIYTFDSQLKKVALLGHAGDYEFVQSQNKEGSVIIKTFTGILSYFWSQPESEGLRNEALEKLKDVWQHARKTLQQNYPRSKLRPILISCQSELCSNLLWNFAKSINSLENSIIICNESPIFGMLAIYNASRQLKTMELIRDGMPFQISVHTPLAEELIILKKTNTFSISGNIFQVCNLPCASGDFHFYQENPMGRFSIGILKIFSLPSRCNGIEATFKRTHEGILMIEKIEYCKKVSWGGNVSKDPLDQTRYDWQPMQLPYATKQQYKQLFEQITPLQPRANNINDEINQVAKIGIIMKRAVKEGNVSFITQLGHDLFLSEIDKVADFMRRPNIQVNELHQQREILQNLALRYQIKIE